MQERTVRTALGDDGWKNKTYNLGIIFISRVKPAAYYEIKFSVQTLPNMTESEITWLEETDPDS